MLNNDLKLVIATIITLILPFLFIWSINTLFEIGIAYTVKTYFAAMVWNMVLYAIIERD